VKAVALPPSPVMIFAVSALALYRSAGFVDHTVDIQYRRDRTA